MHRAVNFMLAASVATFCVAASAQHPLAASSPFLHPATTSPWIDAGVLAPEQPVGESSSLANDPLPEAPLAAANAEGGTTTNSKAKARNARDINAFTSIGVSYGMTVGSIRFYVFAQNRSVQIPTIVYLHPSGHLGPFRFDYMMQEIPVYILHEPRIFNYESVALTPDSRITFGTAILPVGERMIFNPRNRLQVSFYSNGGFSYFTRRILSEGATRFNIALQFGFDFQFAVNDHSSIVVGYADNHLSNSDIHIKNPGLDGNLIFAQYLVRLHRKK